MKPVALILLMLCTGLIASAQSTYYVASNGSDSQDGTEKTHTTGSTGPWLHAPGMPNFTGAYTSAAGDLIILRGGDTWNEASGTPTIGGTWVFSSSGSSGNVIYIGVDQTWFSGGSFTRPIINGNNSLSTGFPASCTHADDSVIYVNVSGNYVTFDNIEFTGDCQTTQSLVEFVELSGSNDIASNLYFHGWTLSSAATDDRRFMLTSSSVTNNATLNVFDGSDSSAGAVCTNTSCVATVWNGSGTPSPIPATGWAMAGSWNSISKSVFRHVSQAFEGTTFNVWHDNLVEYAFEPGYGRHGNVIEFVGSQPTTFTAYNDITRNINEGQNWNSASPTQTFYNNVWENDQHFPPDPNCILVEPNSTNTSANVSVTFYDNTVDSTCKMSALSGTWAAGSSSTWENNHLIGFTSISNFLACNSQIGCSSTQTDNGGEIFMTTGTATSQGYVLSNDFRPTLVTNSTVGNGTPPGNNLTATCGTGAFTNDLCSGTTNGCAETSGSGGLVASCPAIAVVARGAAWNTGAYQFVPAASTNGQAGGNSKIGGVASVN